MSRRGRSRSPFSLFSFQDIITCVSGIIILVTLVLALDLSQRKQGSPSLQTAKLASQIRKAISAALEELARLEAEVSRKTEGAQESLGTSASTLEHDIFSINQQIASLQAEVASLRKQEQTVAEQESKLQAKRFDRDKDIKKVSDQESKAKDLDTELRTLRSQGKVFYNARTADGKQVWLLQLEGSRVLVAAAGSNGPPTVLENKASLFGASPFERWLSSRSTSTDFLFLLVRPDGTDQFDQVKDLLLKRRFSFGFDVIGLKQSGVESQEETPGP